MWLSLLLLAATGGKQLTFSLHKSCLRGVFFVAFDLYPDCMHDMTYNVFLFVCELILSICNYQK